MTFSDWTAKDFLLLALAITTVVYVVVLGAGLARARRMASERGETATPSAAGVATGFVTNFFDTLGIGSFATTTSIYRQWRLVRDEIIPGTLNVGHTLPTIAQAFIFTRIVPVDSRTLILMIVAAVGGAWLGAGIVARWPRQKVQSGMGGALIVAAGLMLASQLGLFPVGGATLKLGGARLGIGVVGNFMLGALMTLGIGLYAPCMILVSLLGMNPTTAFPIMMGSCAFLMPVATARFIRAGRYHPGASLGLLLGGIPAVLLAAFIVKSLPLTAVRYLVIVVVLYTSVNLLRAARRERGLLSPP
ncbi:MAG: sulfite exporter TauE/SafE family protein [Gemmatimonadales bacterium]